MSLNRPKVREMPGRKSCWGKLTKCLLLTWCLGKCQRLVASCMCVYYSTWLEVPWRVREMPWNFPVPGYWSPCSHYGCVFMLLFRLTNAFAYYGIVLVTTELFQVDDVCGSKFLRFHLSHYKRCSRCVPSRRCYHCIVSCLVEWLPSYIDH